MTLHFKKLINSVIFLDHLCYILLFELHLKVQFHIFDLLHKITPLN